ncbi:hypothetical protein [Nocardioides mangrovicus]|nr:hypothetical protein [Nocardioides mangrovicus]
MHDVIHWVLDFIGVHNGEDRFSTRMYNFWSGFGGNISVLALGGTIFGVYRHNAKLLLRLNPLRHRGHRRDETDPDQTEPDTTEPDHS